MNFIDKYKKDLEEGKIQPEIHVDIPEDVDEEALKKMIQNTQLLQFSNKPTKEDREYLQEEMTFLAGLYCDCAEVFFERLKGKLTYNRIVPLIQSFYEMITEVID